MLGPSPYASYASGTGGTEAEGVVLIVPAVYQFTLHEKPDTVDTTVRDLTDPVCSFTIHIHPKKTY